jgi:hypothetical protein
MNDVSMSMKKLVAVINGEATIEYDRSRELPEQQKDCLHKMDEKMDQGIPHGQGNIFSPQMEHKAQFVAAQLVAAIADDNEQLIVAAMAYLATRLVDLQQVVAEEKDGATTIKLIYDKAYAKEQAVQFVRPEHLNS